MSEIDFCNRPRKRNIETYNASLVTSTGGWFGLTANNDEWHYDTYKRILRKDSPFVVVDKDPVIVKGINERAKISQTDITTYCGDLFEVLRSLERPEVRVPLFTYGHFDFCSAASSMQHNAKLEQHIWWLAQWNDLKDTFFFDMTFCKRMDLYRGYETIIDKTIPQAFGSCGWDVYNPKTPYALNGGVNPIKLTQDHITFMHSYKDGSPMVNAMYKVVRKPRSK